MGEAADDYIDKYLFDYSFYRRRSPSKLAQKTYYFSGKAAWAKVFQPDTKYGVKYTIDVLLDDASLDLFRSSGSRVKERKDEKTGEVYIKFSRDEEGFRKGEKVTFGPPEVLGPDNKPWTALIGNGSVVTCKVEVYDSAHGKGTRLAAVRVDEHVPFEGNTVVGEELF